ncbi:hypothetical protein ACWD7F_12800 [Streptomyces sp. NPDC005122]
MAVVVMVSGATVAVMAAVAAVAAVMAMAAAMAGERSAPRLTCDS